VSDAAAMHEAWRWLRQAEEDLDAATQLAGEALEAVRGRLGPRPSGPATVA
jgi:hypothetical protein